MTLVRTRKTFCEIQKSDLELFEVIERLHDNQTTTINMPPKKAARPAQENISLGPQVRDGNSLFSPSKTVELTPASGELVFGVARIFASFNDTFVHVTDLSYVHP